MLRHPVNERFIADVYKEWIVFENFLMDSHHKLHAQILR